MATFDTEREGQIEFFKTFLPLVDPNLSLEDILADDNDGVLNGNLLEFNERMRPGSISRLKSDSGLTVTASESCSPCGHI